MWPRVLLAVGLAMPLPLSAVVNQSFQVSATITPGCLIVGGGANYGTLAYGSYSALATSTVTAALTGGVTLQCTPGVALSMSVDGGLYSSTGRNLQLNIKEGCHGLCFATVMDRGFRLGGVVLGRVCTGGQFGADLAHRPGAGG